MEGQGQELPLKVCPHCSVASRTDAETCPSCGKSFVRGRPSLRLRWSWWLAIPIVIAAFAIGYFGISKLIDDGGDDGVITTEQAQGVATGSSRAELDAALDGEAPAFTDRPRGKPPTMCLYYGIEGQSDGVWEFCFADDELLTTAPVGAGAPQVPAP